MFLRFERQILHLPGILYKTDDAGTVYTPDQLLCRTPKQFYSGQVRLSNSIMISIMRAQFIAYRLYNL